VFNLVNYTQLLQNVTDAVGANPKGDAFEAACSYLFSELDGVLIEGRDSSMAAEEIDIVLWNAQIEESLKPFDYTILVECKNWTKPADAKALDSFIGKVRRRDLKTGIFIAANGVTGDFLNADNGAGAIEIIKGALQEGIRVIIINEEDLRAITTIDDFRKLIRKRFCGLFIHKLFNN